MGVIELTSPTNQELAPTRARIRFNKYLQLDPAKPIARSNKTND